MKILLLAVLVPVMSQATSADAFTGYYDPSSWMTAVQASVPNSEIITLDLTNRFQSPLVSVTEYTFFGGVYPTPVLPDNSGQLALNLTVHDTGQISFSEPVYGMAALMSMPVVTTGIEFGSGNDILGGPYFPDAAHFVPNGSRDIDGNPEYEFNGFYGFTLVTGPGVDPTNDPNTYEFGPVSPYAGSLTRANGQGFSMSQIEVVVATPEPRPCLATLLGLGFLSFAASRYRRSRDPICLTDQS